MTFTPLYLIEGVALNSTGDMVAGSLADGMQRQLPGQHREKIYPWDSVGVEIDGVQDTWSLPKVIIPIDGITRDYGYGGGGGAPVFNVTGFNIISKANPDDALTIQFFRVQKAIAVTLDADSGVSELNADRIYVANTSSFEEDDYVWVMDGNTANGEIGSIASIVTNDYLDLDADLTLDYTTAQSAKVYLIRRAGEDAYRTIWIKFSANNAKIMWRYNLHAPRAFAAGDGLIARVYDIEDVAGPGQVYITAIYDDEA